MPITKTSYSFPKNVLVYCIIDKRSLSTWNGIARMRVVAERQAANFQIAAGAQTASPGVCPGVFMCGRLPFLDSRVLRCYGCGDPLKPIPSPHDLVLITRLHPQKYVKDRVRVM